MLASTQRTISREWTRLRRDGLAALLWSSRITVAATASYVVAVLLFPGTIPLLAPLTAMLVVQVTPVSLLASGVDRVISVVSGVTLAVVFASMLPLTWWSLGLLIFVAITLGQVLRLKANLVEVAISAMLVLGVGALAAEAAAWQRITETLVGAAVGIAANLLFPPKVASADAGDAIDGLADRLSELLSRAKDELTGLVTGGGDISPAARDWLDEARTITHDMPRIWQALLQAEEGRRLNVRAVGTADVGPGLRQGLESLEHSAVAIRSMFRSVLDATLETDWLDDESLSAEDVFPGIAQAFGELAACVDAFGQLVHDEGDPTSRVSDSDVHPLREAQDGMNEARARLEEALLAGGPRPLVELNAALLATVKRMQREMDLDERLRRQLRTLRRSRPARSDLDLDDEAEWTVSMEYDPEADTQRIPVARRPKRRP